MPDVVAAPSSATEQSLDIPAQGPAYDKWRLSGELPSKEESAAASTEKKSSEAEKDESAAPAEGAQESQEAGKAKAAAPKGELKPAGKHKPNASQRIQQLEANLDAILGDESLSAKERAERVGGLNATIERIRRDAGIEPKPKAVEGKQDEKNGAEASDAQPLYYTRPKPKVDDRGADGKAKYATYEDFTEALTDWKADEREAKKAYAQATDDAESQLTEVRKVYPDFDEKAKPVGKLLYGDPKIPAAIKAMLNDSEVLPHVLYTLAGDEKGLDEFIKLARRNPSAAIRKLVAIETGVREELAKTNGGQGSQARGEDGKFQPENKRKITETPPPPREVGGRGTPPGDEAEAALEKGDMAAYTQAMNRRDLAKRKGN